MTSPISLAPPAPAARPADAAAQLRAASRDLEAVFVEQMFKAMRETVPENGLMSGGSAEEMFTTLLDQHLAGEVPGRRHSELAEAVYRQLRDRAGIQEVRARQDAATSDTTALHAHGLD